LGGSLYGFSSGYLGAAPNTEGVTSFLRSLVTTLLASLFTGAYVIEALTTDSGSSTFFAKGLLFFAG
jgi:hypothetical protein